MRRGLLIAASLLAMSQWACDGDRGCHHGCDVTGPSGMVIGSGHLATEVRDVGDFDGLAAHGAVRVIVEPGSPGRLEVTAEDNLLPLMRSEVIGGTLQLGPVADVRVSRTREVVFRVSARHVERIEVSGASVVEVAGIAADRLEVVVSGASSLEAEGVADRAFVSASGASRIHAAELRTRTLDAALAGASYGLLRVAERLEGTVTGASSLEYLGDPAVFVQTSGGSVVRRVGP